MGEQILRESIHPRHKNYRQRKNLKTRRKAKGRETLSKIPATQGSNSVFFDIAGIDAKVSHLPQVREVR